MRCFVVVRIVAFFFHVENLGAQEHKIALLDQLFSSLHFQKKFNGAVVIGEKGKIIFSKGYGYADFANSLPFTPSTASDGGSNAKTLTATAILLLAEQGKLHLHDTVQRYLPAYPYSNTTILNLITHSTGGLPDYDFYFNKTGDSLVLTAQRIVHLLNQYKPTLPYQPGSNFYYDSPGFDLAAAIVEQVSGLTYQQFLLRHFFLPLKMGSSFVRPARLAEWVGERTKGYRIQNDTLTLYDISDREGFYGGSNIWFSATDLYRWGTSFYYHPVFPQQIIEQIVQPVFFNNKRSSIRLGAWYPGKNDQTFYYWGDLFGFYSWVYWDKKQQFTIAFVSNTGTPQWIRPQLTSALVDIMERKQLASLKEPDADNIHERNTKAVTGIYDVNGYGRVKILLAGNSPILRLGNSMEYKIVQVDSKTFYVPGLEAWVSFRSLKDNGFQEIIWNSTTLQTVGKK